MYKDFVKYIYIHRIWIHASCCCRGCFTQDFTMFRLEIQIPSSSCLKQSVARPQLRRTMSGVAWSFTQLHGPSHHRYSAWDLFAAMFGAEKTLPTSGKLYRALWRTCGMFRASRWWFTSGPGLQKWKGCIEAWFWEALVFTTKGITSWKPDGFLLDAWVNVIFTYIYCK